MRPSMGPLAGGARDVCCPVPRLGFHATRVPRGVGEGRTVTGVLCQKEAEKRGSGLRWVSEVIQVIQMRHRAQHKIVPCQPRDLAWITSKSMGNEV